ncbi:MAG: hypothetical protein JRJ48_07615, partial [Deltaproteobacteria bacterium]|nr:hypothetical protein [Deltaproteobacteria bacterium]
MKRKRITIATIFIMLAVTAFFAAPSFAAGKDFVPHKNVPGSKRLHMEKADNSGTVHKDPEYIADRQ